MNGPVGTLPAQAALPAMATLSVLAHLPGSSARLPIPLSELVR